VVTAASTSPAAAPPQQQSAHPAACILPSLAEGSEDQPTLLAVVDYLARWRATRPRSPCHLQLSRCLFAALFSPPPPTARPTSRVITQIVRMEVIQRLWVTVWPLATTATGRPPPPPRHNLCWITPSKDCSLSRPSTVYQTH
jgi:hypothetical protein